VTLPTKADLIALQRALLTVPGVTLPRFGADGDWGSETRAALALVISKAGGQAVLGALGAPYVNSGSLPPGYLAMLARIESGNRPYVKARTSSASGLYQFIKKTWLGEGGTWGPNMALAFGGLQPSVAEQDARATTFTLRNAKDLAAAGIPVTRASLYAAHFLGAGTAVKALRGKDTDRIDRHVDAAAIEANPSILGNGQTVGGFKVWLTRKTA